MREGAAPQISGFLFKAVVQLVLIFGRETWVVTPRMDQVLGGGFQDQVVQRLTGVSTAETSGRKMGVYLSSGGKRGGGVQGDEGISSEKAEHICKFHIYAIDYEPV